MPFYQQAYISARSALIGEFGVGVLPIRRLLLLFLLLSISVSTTDCIVDLFSPIACKNPNSSFTRCKGRILTAVD